MPLRALNNLLPWVILVIAVYVIWGLKPDPPPPPIASDKIITRIEETERERERKRVVITQNREVFNEAVSDYGDELVPDGVLQAFRERRLSRERLGCALSNCKSEPSPDPVATRK